jgi:hypothetical protein
MTRDRLVQSAALWFMRFTAAVQAGNRSQAMVAALANGMCHAAYIGEFVAGAVGNEYAKP